jgi:hypothetical protein
MMLLHSTKFSINTHCASTADNDREHGDANSQAFRNPLESISAMQPMRKGFRQLSELRKQEIQIC